MLPTQLERLGMLIREGSQVVKFQPSLSLKYSSSRPLWSLCDRERGKLLLSAEIGGLRPTEW